MFNICVALLGYLFGSLSSAIIVCKLMGLGDPRQGGSGNPGATNVLRLYSKKAAALTLFCDVLKGVIPVMIAKYIQIADIFIALTGMAAFFGHLFPVFFKFKGGKGVATLIGVLLGTYWLLGLAYIATWLTIVFLFRYSSIAALVAAIMTPVYAWYLLSLPVYVLYFSLMVVALIWRHRSNIENLLSGTEDKIGHKKSS